MIVQIQWPEGQRSNRTFWYRKRAQDTFHSLELESDLCSKTIGSFEWEIHLDTKICVPHFLKANFTYLHILWLLVFFVLSCHLIFVFYRCCLFFFFNLDKLSNLLNRSKKQISRSIVSNSLRPHESQHARPTCPSPTPDTSIIKWRIYKVLTVSSIPEIKMKLNCTMTNLVLFT